MVYPYYIVPDIERYELLDPDSEEARRLARRISVNVYSREPAELYDLLEVSDNEKDGGETEASEFGTIEAFLDKYGGNGAPVGYMAAQIKEEEKPEFPNSKGSQEPQKQLSHLIKSRRYQEALELIELQNLNNPQKSIYFAHQMRFIKKLIALERFKNRHKEP